MMKRRRFLANGLAAGAGSLLIPPFLSEEGTSARAAVAPKFKPIVSEWSDTQMTMAWIGHSTVLINFFGVWIITDPVFSDKIGINLLGATIGISRLTLPAIPMEEIPKVDIVLLSHAHMDHMDYPSLEYLAEKFPHQIDVITAYKTKDVIDDLPWKSLHEMDWDDTYSIGDTAFQALPVKHFGWRYPWEKDRSKGFFKTGRSYNAYLIERMGHSIVFGGDTAYTDKFGLIKNRDVDVAIMPIGAYNPWKSVHCNPEEALTMADEMQAKHFIPIHCYTFKQGTDPLTEPLKRLVTAAPNYKTRVGLVQIGQTFHLHTV